MYYSVFKKKLKSSSSSDTVFFSALLSFGRYSRWWKSKVSELFLVFTCDLTRSKRWTDLTDEWCAQISRYCLSVEVNWMLSVQDSFERLMYLNYSTTTHTCRYISQRKISWQRPSARRTDCGRVMRGSAPACRSILTMSTSPLRTASNSGGRGTDDWLALAPRLTSSCTISRNAPRHLRTHPPFRDFICLLSSKAQSLSGTVQYTYIYKLSEPLCSLDHKDQNKLTFKHVYTQ